MEKMTYGMEPKKLIDLNALIFKLTGKLSAAQDKGLSGAGISYIPPLNAKLTNTAPKKPLSLRAAPGTKLPDNFSWNNDAQVKQYKGAQYVGLIMKPQSQLACGSCWSFSVSTALSDRIAILTKSNPLLGPTFLISYGLSTDNPALQGCNGGSIQDALEVMSRAPGGTVSSNCWSYEWCSSDENCKKGGDGDSANSIVPRFQTKKCISKKSPIQNIFHVLPHSVNGLDTFDSNQAPTQAQLEATFHEIKNDIFLNGSIPTGFIVFNDFFLGSSPGMGNWKETGGIYCHLEVDPNTGRDKRGNPFPYKYGCDKDATECLSFMQAQAGGHAVCILGWGIDTVKNFVPKSVKGSTIQLPYWIVRNSWGDTWCNKGFFKIAMTNVDLGFNTEVKLDNSFGGLGGPITFSPAVNGTKIFNVEKPQKKMRLSLPSLPTSVKSWGYILFIIFLIFVGVYLYGMFTRKFL